MAEQSMPPEPALAEEELPDTAAWELADPVVLEPDPAPPLEVEDGAPLVLEPLPLPDPAADADVDATPWLLPRDDAEEDPSWDPLTRLEEPVPVALSEPLAPPLEEMGASPARIVKSQAVTQRRARQVAGKRFTGRIKTPGADGVGLEGLRRRCSTRVFIRVCPGG